MITQSAQLFTLIILAVLLVETHGQVMLNNDILSGNLTLHARTTRRII
jgi:hypothetical protein